MTKPVTAPADGTGEETDTRRPEDDEPRVRRAHQWLLVLPFLWQVAAVPWANGITLKVWSLPFLLVWQMAGVLFATAVIALVYRIDRRAAGGSDE